MKAKVAIPARSKRHISSTGYLPATTQRVCRAIELIGQYQGAGVELLINSDQRNGAETRELCASDVTPSVA